MPNGGKTMSHLLEVMIGTILGKLTGFIINYGLVIGLVYFIFRTKINVLFDFIKSLTNHYNAQSKTNQK